MNLTGKCKEDFERWAFKNMNAKYILGEFSITVDGFIIPFKFFTESMKWGVYVDFFDSVGIEVNAYRVLEDAFNSETDNWIGVWSSMDEARTEAIKKANEIYNAT